MDENEFESQPLVSPKSGVAIVNKHAYNTVVVPSTKSEPSPMKVISNKHRRDKINSLEQKEENLEKAGVTRYKYMLRIAEALDAVNEERRRDAQGNEVIVMVPDAKRNQWGAEMAAKLHGDLIERKEIEHDIGETTLDKLKSLSVTELKARASEILLGKHSSRVVDADTRTLPS